jgi:membrane protein implicated in regulation of membrane protease activity
MRKYSLMVMLLTVVTLAAVVLAPASSAHHGWSEYQDEQFEITGTLETPVSLAGPHATAQIRVDDEVWDLVLAPSPRTARAGLTEDVIPVGDTVTASGHRHLDPATLEIKTERLTWNETVFDVYPDRN